VLLAEDQGPINVGCKAAHAYYLVVSVSWGLGNGLALQGLLRPGQGASWGWVSPEGWTRDGRQSKSSAVSKSQVLVGCRTEALAGCQLSASLSSLPYGHCSVTTCFIKASKRVR
jgi:hypothetical protein